MSNVHKLSIGQRAKVVGNTVSHNMPLGSMVTIKALNIHGYNIVESASYCGFVDIQAVECSREDLIKQQEMINNEMEDLRTQSAVITSKISYLNETGSKIVSNAEFQAYHTLKVLEKGELSTLEKARQIARLFSSNM